MHCRGVVAMLVLAGLVLPGTAAGATIGGTVWSDANANGRRDRGEPGIRAVAVAVQRKRGRAFTTVTTKLTGRTGAWSYRIGRAGTYRARVTLPPGTTLSPKGRDSDLRSRTTPARRLTRRGRSVRYDAGIVPPRTASPVASTTPPIVPVAPALTPTPPAPPAPPPPPVYAIGDRVWNDGDDDGRQDPNELGVGGVTVEAWDAGRTAMLASTVSAADGRWSLPVSGTARLRVVLPSAARYTSHSVGDEALDSDIRGVGADAGFSDPFTPTADRTDLDVGLAFPGMANVGNRLWRDEDGDGIQDAAETSTQGIGSRKVELWNASLTQKLDEDTTSAGGTWSLPVPRYLEFRIRIAVAVQHLATDAFAGADDALDSNFVAESDASALTPPDSVSASDTTIDAGIVPAFYMGNRAWRDLNENGIQDPGEPGLAGVTVQAWTTSPFEEVRTTTTNANGAYELILEIPHSYRVRFLRPPGLTWTVKNAGSDDQEDSDANQAAAANPGFADVFTPTEFLVSTTQWDAGFVPE